MRFESGLQCLVMGAVLGGAGRLTGQEIVVPAGSGVGDLAKTEGNDGFQLPARYAPSRLIVVYRGKELPVGDQGFQIGSVALRRDGPRTTAFKDHTWRMTIVMSARGVVPPAELPAESFSAAHGTDRTSVLDGKLVNWPAEPQPNPAPAPFKVQIKLDKPFLLGKGQNLCVDFMAESQSQQPENGYWYVDSQTFDRSGSVGQDRSFGRGCPFGFQAYAQVPPLDGESRIETYAYTRWTGPLPTFAFLVVGSQTASWGKLVLPFDLTAIGAPGCSLYTEPTWIGTGRTIASDARGTVRFQSGSLPRDPVFTGFKLYQQVLVADAAANALGIRASNGLELTLGKVADPLPARLLYHSGPDVTDTPTAALDMGVVLRLGQ